MKQFIRDYFTFDRRQRNGVFILLSVILLLILYLSFADYFFPKEKIDFTKFEKEITAFEAAIKQAEDSAKVSHKSYFNSDAEEKDSIYHTVNKISSAEKSFESKFPKKDANVIVDLNSADTSVFKQLKGIGSVFAKRIVKFRDLLGGFVRKEQLLEVYGFDKEKYDGISSQLTVDLSKVKTININSASVDDLDKHPYIDKKTAVKIFFQRTNHGSYSEVSDLKKFNLADAETFTKIAPYLEVE